MERVGILCSGCLGRAPPFVGLVGEGEYREALREYREGLGSRFDPFDDEVMWALEGSDGALRGSAYVGGGELGGCLRNIARGGGFSLSLMCLNISRSNRGTGLELLEANMQRWAEPWDVVGLVEKWLDEESEKGLAVDGYGCCVCQGRGHVMVGWRY